MTDPQTPAYSRFLEALQPELARIYEAASGGMGGTAPDLATDQTYDLIRTSTGGVEAAPHSESPSGTVFRTLDAKELRRYSSVSEMVEAIGRDLWNRLHEGGDEHP